MVKLLVENNFQMIKQGTISHVIVRKEEGIKRGDFVSLYDNNGTNCLMKVNYVDCEGSGVDENYCIISIKKV